MVFKPITRAQQSIFRFNKSKIEAGAAPSQLEMNLASVPQYHADDMNINVLYLESIHALINQYIISSYRNNLEQALNALQLLATTMAPKVDTDKEERMIDQLEASLLKAVVHDTDGSVIRYNPTVLAQARIWTRRIYKMLLMKLDARGMLTFSPKDYKSILGDFSKA